MAVFIQGVPEKIAQSLCTTILQPYVTVMRFSAKCLEINWLHDKGQCLNTTIKYSLFCSWQVIFFENKISSKIFKANSWYEQISLQARFPELREYSVTLTSDPKT